MVQRGLSAAPPVQKAPLSVFPPLRAMKKFYAKSVQFIFRQLLTADVFREGRAKSC
jgi:hypothetical protein